MSLVQLCFRTTVCLATLLIQLINSSALELTKITSPTSEAFMFQNEMKFVYKYKGSPDSPNSALKVSNSSTIQPVNLVTKRKWQIGRVSRKQYEIVNLLWRKTNVFNDIELSLLHSSTKPYNTALLKRQAKYFSKVFPSTMSFIEFYYQDDNVDPRDIKLVKSNLDRGVKAEHFLISPFAFALNPSYKRPISTPVLTRFYEEEPITEVTQFYETAPIPAVSKLYPYGMEQNYLVKKSTPFETRLNLLRNSRYLQNFLLRNAAERQISNSEMTNTPPRTTTTKTVSATPGLLSSTDVIDSYEPSTTYPSKNSYTTANDRIKFFELYDSNTLDPATIEKDSSNILNMSVILDNTTASIGNTEPTSYETESAYVTVKIKHSKKDVTRQNDLGEKTLIRAVKFQEQNKTIRSVHSNDEENILGLNEDHIMNVNDRMKTHIQDRNINLTISRSVPWREYPFAAVYVYERFQVHCDAAAISQHWLIASGSCLSRHQNYLYAELRSAFVSYCGESWWNPERINYVKSTRVHPRYDRKDLIRRHLYNIGVIQVTTSMASSCIKWSPITVMSYQYVAELEGSVGTAVGWGLDRYDTSYASADLPKKLLAAYESVIYSNSCPGNTGYRNTEKVSKEAVSTVYCLSLPNYTDEEHDPVHGGILLVGGKLIALYLQEERQQWGPQSAQYTGVWRLMPWLLEVAKEPEEMDFFV